MDQALNSTHAAYSKVTARAWTDPAFKARLMANPAAVLKEAGVDVPSGMKVKAVENTSDTAHFILPAPPADGELSEESLSKVAGGTVITVACIICICV
jgi:nitrile hydratase alpha subunit